jgi:hypothetical protein
MFIPNIFPFISMIDDAGDNGGGENTQDDNLGVPLDYGQEEQQNNQPEEVKLNPAWNKVLEPLPQEFHKQITPHLQEWDSNFAKVQSEYAPYKPLLENNVPFESIQKAFQLAELLNANPRAVYDELGQRFGFNSGQGQQQVEDEKDDTDDQLDVGQQQFDITKNPQFVQLQNAFNALQQGITQQQEQEIRAQQEAQAQREIDSEFAALESKTGKLDESVKTEIVRRAIMLGDARGDGQYHIEEGYRDYAAFVNRIRNSRANSTAPDVLNGNGGIPQTKRKYSEMDEEERVNHWAAMAERIANENQ